MRGGNLEGLKKGPKADLKLHQRGKPSCRMQRVVGCFFCQHLNKVGGKKKKKKAG